MKRQTVTLGVDDLAAVGGGVLARDLILARFGGGTIRRGTALDVALRENLARYPGLRLHLALPEPGEIGQADASERLAAALAGRGVRAEAPHQGQVILRAATDGLARVRRSVVERVNRTGAALVASALDGRVVRSDETLAVIKAPRLWMPNDEIDRVLSLTRGAAALRVAPFGVRRAAFLAGPRLRPANVRAAEANLTNTLAPFGAALVRAEQVAEGVEPIAAAIGDAIAHGSEVVFIAGSIVLDPGDPFLQAVEQLGGRIVCRGAPVDPGTMFWVGYVGKAACFGLASCEMYGRVSILDLVLPYALARQRIDLGLLAELGYGGLLEQTFAARRAPLGSSQLALADLASDEGEADEADDDAEPEGAEADDQRRGGGDGRVVGDVQQEQQAGQAALRGGEAARKH